MLTAIETGHIPDAELSFRWLAKVLTAVKCTMQDMCVKDALSRAFYKGPSTYGSWGYIFPVLLHPLFLRALGSLIR